MIGLLNGIFQFQLILDKYFSLNFFCNGLGLKEARRMEFEDERFTLIFLSAPNDSDAELELTYNWDGDDLNTSSRNFGHIAYRVKNIYEI